MRVSSPTETRQAVIAAAFALPLSLLGAVLTVGLFGVVV